MTYPAVTAAPKVRLLDAPKAAEFATAMGDEEAAAMLTKISHCKATKRAEMARLAELSDRWDNLYYPENVTAGGADHWPDDPNLQKPGMVHVSINAYTSYVDIPAALQATLPIENIAPADPESDDDKKIAAMVERVYFAWKHETQFELKASKCAVTKTLYGRSAAKVWWDDDAGHPVVSIIEQPRNLWLGWSDTDHSRLDWAIYIWKLTPEAVLEEYGLDVNYGTDAAGNLYSIVGPPISNQSNGVLGYQRPQRDNQEDLGMIEVHDYWYRRPKGKVRPGKKTTMETWNAILVGNHMVKNKPYPEYDGEMPYVPVFNTFIPGLADGRSSLYDVEQIIREKDERLSAGGTIINSATKGHMFQLVGPDAPDKVPSGGGPKPGRTVAPGAGNRYESIDPYMPEFQLEQFLVRLDREAALVSGINDLLLGLAPSHILSSSKAINALVGNYEQRIKIARALYYQWRIDTWMKARLIWGNKDAKIKEIFKIAGRLVIKNPSLTPRDDLETAQRSLNLMNSKVWSNVRAMDANGVDDPEAEQTQIREEQTDASLNPGSVIQQLSALSAAKQLGVDAQGQQQLAQGGPIGQNGQPSPGITPDQAANAARQQYGGQSGSPGMNQPGESPSTPNEAQPANAQQEALAALLGTPQGGVLQQQVTSTGAKSRIRLQQPLGPGGTPGGGYTPGG